MRYFTKANVYNTIYSAGLPVEFVEIEGGMGVIKTDAPPVIAELEARISEKRGGITEISADQYEEYIQKKNHLSQPQRQQLRSGIESARQQSQPPLRAHQEEDPAAAENAGNQPEDNTKTHASRPATARIKR